MPTEISNPLNAAFDRDDDLKQRAFADALMRAQKLVARMDDAVFAGAEAHATPDLIAAMRYAVEGGKALRAFLVFESGRILGQDSRKTAWAANAIEYMHAYSLIHDDLPCMDDDDMRRGKPTVHRAWNEHTAVLAGDALQSLAFDLLCHPDLGGDRVSRRLVQDMAKAAGHPGMVGGQMMDIAAESAAAPFTLDQIIAVQRGKTGALIGWSARAGVVIADAPDADLQAFDTYGEKLGLAFQIADDILDVEGDAEAMGKAVGKDADRGKATFVSLLGLDGAKRRASELVQDACDALDMYSDDASCLREAAQFVVSRRN